MTKCKIIVTGGAGFIGSHLTRKLASLGHEVHVVDDLSSGKAENIPVGAELHVQDIRDGQDLLAIFEGASYVFHLAAIPSVEYSIWHPEKTHDVNTNGTFNVLVASRKAGVKKIIYASSSSVYGDQSSLSLKESLTPVPKSPYALEKYIGEQYFRLWAELYKVNSISLRFFNVYGPGQHEEGAYAFVIAKFLKHFREGTPLPVTGDGSHSRDFVHVSDVVEACIKAMNVRTSSGDIINIGSGKGHSVKEIASLIGGKTTRIPARIEQKDTLADNTKAKNILKWFPKITLEKGISELQVKSIINIPTPQSKS